MRLRLRALRRGLEGSRRAFSGTRQEASVEDLRRLYIAAREACRVSESAPLTNPRAVFANNEFDLGRVDVYGFDYDYTLAVYTRDLHRLIYRLAMGRLIRDLKYPEGIASIPYSHRFPVRGLHFDQTKGLLFKLDAYAKIQPGTVYRGFTQLSDEAVNRAYPGHRISFEALRQVGSKGAELRHIADLFSLPEIGLISSVIEYFDGIAVNADAYALSQDVKSAVSLVHTSGELYAHITNNCARFIHSNPGLRDFLLRLRAADKTTFVMTNSPFAFMSRGMSYLVGEDWRELFDFVVVNAQKPRFFKDSLIPFREVVPETGQISWHRVGDLEKGRVYAGGNLKDFVNMTGIYPKGVLYFGDHIDTDLKDPMLRLGWRTGAIVPELGGEIATHNGREYRRLVGWLPTLTALVEAHQGAAAQSPAAADLLRAWEAEREELFKALKFMSNPHFGSAFRTFHCHSYFSERLMRLADVYTSRLPNLLQYSLDHTFYPRRFPLPHEPTITHFPVPGSPTWLPQLVTSGEAEEEE